MTNTYRYEVVAMPSGWCLYDNALGQKVRSFTARNIGRYEALKALYDINNWDWKKSKYVREQPYLATI